MANQQPFDGAGIRFFPWFRAGDEIADFVALRRGSGGQYPGLQPGRGVGAVHRPRLGFHRDQLVGPDRRISPPFVTGQYLAHGVRVHPGGLPDGRLLHKLKVRMQLSPYERHPPGARSLLRMVATALCLAATLLLLVILPAEYSIDPTGIGARLDILGISGIVPTDVIPVAARQPVSPVSATVLDPDEPSPLADPAVHQPNQTPYRSELIEIHMAADEQQK